MKIALLSDIHGNDLALEAVLADIETQGGVDAYWVLGDLVAIGPHPAKVLEKLSTLPNASFIRGNTDRYVCTGERPGPGLAAIQGDLESLTNRLELEAIMAWTHGAITATGWFDWLDHLPLDMRKTLQDGTRVLVVHATPGSDEKPGILPGMEPAEIQARLADSDAEMICLGHTHHAFTLQIDEKQVVNPGSISNPLDADLRPSYAIIHADKDRHSIEHRRVTYNPEAVVAAINRMRHPGARFIIKRVIGSK